MTGADILAVVAIALAGISMILAVAAIGMLAATARARATAATAEHVVLSSLERDEDAR